MKEVAWILGLAAAGGALALAQPQGSVVDSPHNLSASGPGAIRAPTEEQVCIFCHTPHNARPIRPLWNRYTPIEAYRIYSSQSLDAQPGQPTGASKMCLSCHDGTIALGAVFSRTTPIPLAGGTQTLPPGPSNLGTDLSDDHPISFRYDSALATRDTRLRDPSALPPHLPLDHNGELQCTTCHDAHDDSRGNFLNMFNDGSQLCIACHTMGTTTVQHHSNCSDCHQPHSAPSGPYLLRGPTTTDTCLLCHDGSHPGAIDIASDLQKVFRHGAGSLVPNTDVDCADCHEPHTMAHGSAPAPQLHPNLGEIDGVSLSGSALARASTEYEVCFKCHADASTAQPIVSRQIVQNNTRLEFSPTAVSFHPVAAPGRNPDVPSLRPGWSESSYVACTDCHASDTGTRAIGGSGADGPHGSNLEPLLLARYETADFTSESAQAYALCYQCHDRSSILGDESFPEHRLHIVEERTSCATCHDAHGIASVQGSMSANSHLINFDTSVVFRDQATGRLEFRDTGFLSGECFLRCHGENHSPQTYP
ncbi:MAG: cytochrome c3 family protein [Phycisphaerales bacterium JB039]